MQKLAAIFLTSDKPHYPFELPKGWCFTNIGELLINRDGERKPVSSAIRSKQLNKIYDYYGAAGVIDKIDDYLFDEKLLLIGEDGANLLSKSKNNAFFAEGKYWVNNHAHVLDATDKNLLEYVAIVINAIKLDDYITGSAQPKLSQDNLNKIPIVLPPLSEQKRIMEAIIHWSLLIEQIEQNKIDLQASIKQAKSKVLDLAIHGKLVQQDPNDEPASELLKRINPKAEIITDNGHYQKLPVGWTICRLKDISKIVTGSTPSKSNRGYYGGIFPFFKPADLDAGRHVYKATECLSEDGKKVSRVVPKGATAICCIGTIGKVGYLMYEGATNQQINCAIPSKVVDSVFLFYLCASPLFNDKLNSESSAVTISIVNKSKIEAISVPLPPLAEQKRIVSKIEEIFAQLEAIETAL